MKKLLTYLILTLCMLISSVAMAGEIIPRDAFMGKWYFAGSEVEGDWHTAQESDTHIYIDIFVENDTFVAYYWDEKNPAEQERYVHLEYHPKESSQNKYRTPFDGSYVEMFRKTGRRNTKYKLYLEDKDKMLLSAETVMDGAPYAYTWTFTRTNVFAQ